MESTHPPEAQPIPPSPQAPNRFALAPWIVAGLAILGVVACVFWIIPAERKETLKTKEALSFEVQTREAFKRQVDSLKTTLALTRSTRKTKTTEKVALDGTGAAIRGPDGMPVILTTTYVMATDSTAASTTEQIREVEELKRESRLKDDRIKALEHQIQEKRGGGWEILGGMGTSGAYYGHLGLPPIGIFKGALEGRVRPRPELGEIEVEGVGQFGLHF